MQKNLEIPNELARRLAALGQVAGKVEKDFMLELATRQREPNGFETELEALIGGADSGEGAWKKEAFDFFKKLESMGCGKVLLGRRGSKTRIRWTPYGAIAVARAFLGNLVAADGGVLLEVPLGESQVSAVATDGMHCHRFLLRQGLQVCFELPLDLTRDEANRLAEFVRSLPF